MLRKQSSLVCAHAYAPPSTHRHTLTHTRTRTLSRPSHKVRGLIFIHSSTTSSVTFSLLS